MNAGRRAPEDREPRVDPLVAAIEASRWATRRQHDEAAATDVLASLTAPGYEPAFDLGLLSSRRS